MTYSLRRERDGAGDSGPASIIYWIDDGKVKHENFGRPKVGCVVEVGSLTGRSYAAQDYWRTTKVTEILEETENRIRFKTGNSTYVWEII
jgi:hypothetical protein